MNTSDKQPIQTRITMSALVSKPMQRSDSGIFHGDFNLLGIISGMHVYEDPDCGDEAPMWARLELLHPSDITAIDVNCPTHANPDSSGLLIQSPFYDMDDPDEWADWANAILANVTRVTVVS